MSDNTVIDLREKRIRVVLADDSAEIRQLLRLRLEVEGRFEVAGEAASGDELVDVVLDQRPDGVVVDLAMPVMDGFSAITEIRRCSPGTKILVLSAFASPAVRRKAFALGADAVLTKGIPLHEVESTLLTLSRG